MESQRQKPSLPSFERALEDEQRARPGRSRCPDAAERRSRRHLERALHVVREINAAPLFHALYDASRVRRTAFATLVTSLVALTTAAIAYAGNGGFLPRRADSPNGQDVRRRSSSSPIFTGIIFVAVEGG
jgi:hypothetical protein